MSNKTELDLIQQTMETYRNLPRTFEKDQIDYFYLTNRIDDLEYFGHVMRYVDKVALLAHNGTKQ